jgi:hypothetical protein
MLVAFGGFAEARPCANPGGPSPRNPHNCWLWSLVRSHRLRHG